MQDSRVSDVTARPGVFSSGELDELGAFYRRHGFAILAGMLDGPQLADLERECSQAQGALMAGELDPAHGTTELVEPGASAGPGVFPNYVLRITELSPAAASIMELPVVGQVIERCLGPNCWSGNGDRFGFVYQDARPGEHSSYKRIGWHSDWQSGPHLRVWPSTAITVHIDETSPANGFLRLVPGSHRWATGAPYDNVNDAIVPPSSAPWGGYTDEAPPQPMPLRFEKVSGEIAVYAERGDLLFHDCYLWHSAALATDPGSRRRHVRGSWYAGSRPGTLTPADFVKNAAR